MKPVRELITPEMREWAKTQPLSDEAADRCRRIIADWRRERRAEMREAS